MNLKTAEFAATLSSQELEDFSDLLKIWDDQFDEALLAVTDEDMNAIISKAHPLELQPRFEALIYKLKIHNSKLDLDTI